MQEMNLEDYDRVEITGLLTRGQMLPKVEKIQAEIDREVRAKFSKEQSSYNMQRRTYNGRTKVR
jgi:hypothetical protein